MFKALLFVSSLLLSTNAIANKYIDTQYGQNGLEVHIKKVDIKNDVMTIVFEMENTSDDTYKEDAFPIGSVSYNTHDTNYSVLKDTAGKWLASDVSYNFGNAVFTSRSHLAVNTKIEKGKKRLAWIKFRPPHHDEWPIELNLPGVSPFTIPKPQ